MKETSDYNDTPTGQEKDIDFAVYERGTESVSLYKENEVPTDTVFSNIIIFGYYPARSCFCMISRQPSRIYSAEGRSYL